MSSLSMFPKLVVFNTEFDIMHTVRAAFVNELRATIRRGAHSASQVRAAVVVCGYRPLHTRSDRALPPAVWEPNPPIRKRVPADGGHGRADASHLSRYARTHPAPACDAAQSPHVCGPPHVAGMPFSRVIEQVIDEENCVGYVAGSGSVCLWCTTHDRG